MAIPTSITVLDTNEAMNSPAGSDNVGGTLDNFLRAHAMIIRRQFSKGANVNSASTTNLPPDCSFLNVVKVVSTINAFSNAFDGRIIYIKFEGGITLAHSASLVMPAGVDVVTEDGDVAVFVNESTGVWRCLSYPRYQLSTVSSSKNLLINANFDVWPDGTSSTTSGYLGGQWHPNWTGTSAPNVTASRYEFSITEALPDGTRPRYGLEMAVTSGGDATNGNVQLSHNMESVYTLASSSAAYAIWVYCAQAGRSVAVEFARLFGSGGSAIETGIGARKFSLQVGWNLVAGVADIPDLAGKTIGSDNSDRLAFIVHVSAGSAFNTRTDSLGIQTGTFRFARAQIEKGAFHTEFEDRGRAAAHLECSRFYKRFGRTDFILRRSSSGVTAARLPFPTSMRATPTVTVYDLSSNSGRGTVVTTSGSATDNVVVGSVAAQQDGISYLQMSGMPANHDVVCFSRIDVDARY